MRRNSLRTAARSLAPVLLLALFAGAAVADTALEQGQRALRLAARIDSSRFVERIRSLSTSYPSRMIGSDGDSAAAMYVANAFRSIGLKSVQIQEFETVVAKDFLSRIIIPSSGDTINLHAFPPNFARTNTVLPGGIAGKLVYGGQARPANLNGQDIENSIVLMEMNTGRRWTTIATLGAQAALFIEPADPYERELFKGFATSVNFPRFWIERDGGRRLKEHLAENPGTQVVVEAYQPWQTAKGRNVIGYLNGSDPVLLQETVIITAGIDGYSTISTLAPAAEQAGGIAALLELAEIFSKSPPARSVMFVGLDGGGANTGLVGARTLVQALKQNYPGTLALFIQQFREDVRLIGDRKLAAKFPEYREATDALETALEDIVDGSQSDAVDDWRALVLARTAYVTESKATLERQGEELEQARSIYGQAVARAARIFISSFRTVTDELAPLIERFDDLHQQYLVLLHRDVSQLQPIVDADADKIRTDVRGRLAAARLSDVKRALKTLEAIGGDDYRRRLKNTLDGFELVEPLLPKQIALMAHLKLKSHQDGIGVFYKGFFFNQIPDLELKRAFGDIGKRFTSYAANAVINSNLERLWALSDSKIRGGISQEREALIRRKADYEQLVGIENTETTQTYVWYHSAFNAVTWPLALILLLVSGWFVRRVLKDGGQLSPRLIVGLALGLLLVVLKIAGWRWHGTATVDLAIDTLIENYSELLLDADELPRDNKSKIRLIKEKGASYLDIVQTPTYFADNIRHAISKTVTVVTDEITAADAELARINEQLELRDTPVAALSDSQLIRLQRL
ncbi:MAG: M28 family peptidase, partial [Candidatus Latescibacteria bacterium]|nr:M28 family peptidase [Candidatus Latescibacterota bacterium]